MKTEKKGVGTKAAIRAEKERERRIAKTALLASILLIITLLVLFIHSFSAQLLNQPPNPESSQAKAAIIDQLGLTYPNKTFIETAKAILEQAGYTTSYYPSEEVTVDFYRNLPAHGYSLIILRTHSSAAELQGEEYVETSEGIFTSESYSQTKYVYEQLTDQLVMASYTMPQPPYYFAIVPKFVTSSMKGAFQNAIIIVMGCEGLNNTKMAEAFIQKGAKAYIGWKGSVTASYTDAVITCLLQNLLTQKRTIKQAIERAIEETEPDPIHNNLLTYYPLEVG